MHVESLGQGDVTSIGEWGDTQTLLGPEELVGVFRLPVSDVHNAIIRLFIPCDPCLFEPLEILRAGGF